MPPHSQADGIQVPKREDHQNLSRQTGVTIMKHTIVGVDIARNVMQVQTKGGSRLSAVRLRGVTDTINTVTATDFPLR
jgi:hypothetical protein